MGRDSAWDLFHMLTIQMGALTCLIVVECTCVLVNKSRFDNRTCASPPSLLLLLSIQMSLKHGRCFSIEGGDSGDWLEFFAWLISLNWNPSIASFTSEEFQFSSSFEIRIPHPRRKFRQGLLGWSGFEHRTLYCTLLSRDCIVIVLPWQRLQAR